MGFALDLFQFYLTKRNIKQNNATLNICFGLKIKIVIVYSLPWNEYVFSEASFNKHAKLTFKDFGTWVTEDGIFNNILLSNKLVQIIYKEQVNDLSSIWFYLNIGNLSCIANKYHSDNYLGWLYWIVTCRYLSIHHTVQMDNYMLPIQTFSVATLNLCSRFTGVDEEEYTVNHWGFVSSLLWFYLFIKNRI